MLHFHFYNPTHIVFGKDRLTEQDTFVHTVEQYVTLPVDARFQDLV